MRPTKTAYTLLHQVVQHIQPGLIDPKGEGVRDSGTALLAHLILRHLKHVSGWALSFTRLVGTVRGGLWVRRNILEVLWFYGTAGPPSGPMIIGGKPY